MVLSLCQLLFQDFWPLVGLVNGSLAVTQCRGGHLSKVIDAENLKTKKHLLLAANK